MIKNGRDDDRKEKSTDNRDRERMRMRQNERENSNSKTLILKDSSVRSIWTYLTASPCYTTNTNKHNYTTSRYYKRERERE